MIRSYAFLWLCLIGTATLHAEATLDVDLAKVRSLPDWPAIQQQLDAAMPPEAKERLEAFTNLTKCDPRRDLQRIHVELPGPGRAPTIRLVGMPTDPIANALGMHGQRITACGSLSGYPLPERPKALLVVVNDHELLIGRRDLLTDAPAPAPLSPIPAPDVVVFQASPGEHPPLPFLESVVSLEGHSDLVSSIVVTATAKDEAGAIELERRLGVLREMITVGVKGRLPTMADLGDLLAATSVARTNSTLTITVALTADLRQQLVTRLLERLKNHHRQHPHPNQE